MRWQIGTPPLPLSIEAPGGRISREFQALHGRRQLIRPLYETIGGAN